MLEEERAGLLGANSVPCRSRCRDYIEARSIRNRTGRDTQEQSLAQERYAQSGEDSLDRSEENGLPAKSIVQMAFDTQAKDRPDQILAVSGHADGIRFRKSVRLDLAGR